MWFILPLLAGVIFAVSESFAKLVANNDTSAEMKSIIANLLGVLCALLFFPFEKIQISTNIYAISLLILNGGVMACAYVLYYSSFKHVEMSIATLLTKTSVLVYTLGGIYLLREHLSTFQLVGTILVLVSLASVYGTNRVKQIKLDKWAVGLLLTGMLFGISILIDNMLSKYFSPFFYLFAMFSVSSIILIIYFAASKRITFSRPNTNLLLKQFGATALSVCGQALLLSTYRLGGYVSISNLFALIRIPLVVIFGIVIFKEHEHMKQKLISMALLITGLILLKL